LEEFERWYYVMNDSHFPFSSLLTVEPFRSWPTHHFRDTAA